MSKKFSSQKLVRDKTKQRIEIKDADDGYRTLQNNEYVIEKRKLHEEIDELINVNTFEALANEVANIIQVIYHFLKHHNNVK